MLEPLREHREGQDRRARYVPDRREREGKPSDGRGSDQPSDLRLCTLAMPVEAFCADSQAGGKTQHDRDTTPQGRRSQARQKGRVMRQRSDRRSPLRGSFMVPVLWPAAAVQRRSPSSAGGAVPRLTCEFALRRTSADEA